MMRRGLIVAAALGGCSNEPRHTTSPPSDVRDPCAKTPRGDICGVDVPVTTPLILPDGSIRLVFEEDRREDNGGAHCRISDFTRTGVHTVSASCCERGHVVADALDEAGQFFVLCEDEVTYGVKNVGARRMERDGTFHAASPVIGTGFPPPEELHNIFLGDHHLLIVKDEMWVVYDVDEHDFASAYDQTYIQRLTEGAKPVSLEGERFVAAYVWNGALFVTTADHYHGGVFHRITDQQVLELDEPKGAADGRCKDWHGTALDATGVLAEVRFVQLDQADQFTSVALRLPGARPIPSATSRGAAIALCNGSVDGFGYELWLGDLDVERHAAAGSEALSCDAGGCIMVYVADHSVREQDTGREITVPRFWVRRYSPGALRPYM